MDEVNVSDAGPGPTTPRPRSFIQASAKTGEGLEEWCSWLLGQTGDPSESQP